MTESDGSALAARNGHALLPWKPTERGAEWRATTCTRCRRVAQSTRGRILFRGSVWMRKPCRPKPPASWRDT